jgi:uncharacterized membrane protein YeaQ/YmgE (transglycosylase-associated protein family)
MSIIVAIILGGIVGWIASRLLGRNEGVLASILIGIVGSFIGSLISSLLTGSDRSILAFSWSGLFWSLIGAVVLVAIMNAVSRPRHHTI